MILRIIPHEIFSLDTYGRLILRQSYLDNIHYLGSEVIDEHKYRHYFIYTKKRDDKFFVWVVTDHGCLFIPVEVYYRNWQDANYNDLQINTISNNVNIKSVVLDDGIYYFLDYPNIYYIKHTKTNKLCKIKIRGHCYYEIIDKYKNNLFTSQLNGIDEYVNVILKSNEMLVVSTFSSTFIKFEMADHNV